MHLVQRNGENIEETSNYVLQKLSPLDFEGENPTLSLQRSVLNAEYEIQVSLWPYQ